jgi:hypothetical protein
MSVYVPYLLMLIAAMGGWLITEFFLRFLFYPFTPKKIIGFSITGILPAMQFSLSKDIAAAIVQKYLSASILEDKVSNPALIQQLRPEIETHIDRFLKDKLPEAFPLLSKFMGEKTLFKFKEAFLSEVEIIFPAMLKSYSEKLMEEWNPKLVLENKLLTISIPAVRNVFYKQASRQIFLFKLTGIFIGILVGVLQWLLLLLIH